MVQYYNPNTPIYLYLLNLIRLLIITVVPAQQPTTKICNKCTVLQNLTYIYEIYITIIFAVFLKL